MPSHFRAPILSYEKINELAEEFLEKNGIGEELPVPIKVSSPLLMKGFGNSSKKRFW